MFDPGKLPSAQQLLAGIRNRAKLARRQRRRLRSPLVCHVSIFVIGGGVAHWSAALTCDLSTAGLGFSSAEPLSPGDHFIVYLAAGTVKRLILSRCAHARREVGGSRVFGCEFSDVLIVHETAPIIPESWLRRLQSPGGFPPSPFPATPSPARPSRARSRAVRPASPPAPIYEIPGDFT